MKALLVAAALLCTCSANARQAPSSETENGKHVQSNLHRAFQDSNQKGWYDFLRFSQTTIVNAEDRSKVLRKVQKPEMSNSWPGTMLARLHVNFLNVALFNCSYSIWIFLLFYYAVIIRLIWDGRLIRSFWNFLNVHRCQGLQSVPLLVH